jgi:hypothetical protein
MGLVEQTWKEMGFRIRARGYQVWVRTVPFERKVGAIWLPPKLQSFHGELPHLVTTRAVVLSAGPEGFARDVKPGDTVAFKRLHFATYMPVGDPDHQEKVGWIDSNEVMWVEEGAIDGVEVSAA